MKMKQTLLFRDLKKSQIDICEFEMVNNLYNFDILTKNKSQNCKLLVKISIFGTKI